MNETKQTKLLKFWGFKMFQKVRTHDGYHGIIVGATNSHAEVYIAGKTKNYPWIKVAELEVQT